jgi:hypothetical protein
MQKSLDFGPESEELILNIHENLILVWLMGMGITLLYQYIDKFEWHQKLKYVFTAVSFLIIGRIGILAHDSFSPTYIRDLEINLAI